MLLETNHHTGMQADSESSEGVEAEPAGPSGDHGMEDDSFQEFDGHAGQQQQQQAGHNRLSGCCLAASLSAAAAAAMHAPLHDHAREARVWLERPPATKIDACSSFATAVCLQHITPHSAVAWDHLAVTTTVSSSSCNWLSLVVVWCLVQMLCWQRPGVLCSLTWWLQGGRMTRPTCGG